MFATVAICGVTTILQSVRAGWIGTGHLVVMGTSGAFIAVCIAAVSAGGPALLATLVVVSSFVPLVLSARLSLFQRVLTPTVSGTVIMLIPVTVMPAVFDLLAAVPEGSLALAAPLSASIRTISGAVAIQRVSWRRPRAVDFRAVQGAITVDGLGNLLSGLAGTTPNTATTVGASVTELTGVGARSVGVAGGAIFVAVAFLPKMLAVVLAIPGPVFAAYLGVLLATLFAIGMKMAVQDGLDYRKGLIVGVAFWIGVGFQTDLVFPEHVSEFAGGLLRNGVTAGGLAVIVMTLFVEMTKPRRSRIEAAFDLSVLAKVREFLGAFASRSGWDAAMAQRLDAACEETLLTLIRQENEEERRLRLVAYREGGGAVLEFVVASRDENVQDRRALLGDEPGEATAEEEVSLRQLRRLASSVRHRQYRGMDVVTVRVAGPGPVGGGET